MGFLNLVGAVLGFIIISPCLIPLYILFLLPRLIYHVIWYKICGFSPAVDDFVDHVVLEVHYGDDADGRSFNKAYELHGVVLKADGSVIVGPHAFVTGEPIQSTYGQLTISRAKDEEFLHVKSLGGETYTFFFTHDISGNTWTRRVPRQSTAPPSSPSFWSEFKESGIEAFAFLQGFAKGNRDRR